MQLNKENYLKLKNSGKYTRPQMAGLLEVPDWKLKKWIANTGLGTKRPVLSNPRVFKEDTKESNYWAGFIAADGCVDSKGRVRLYLQLSDIEHLKKFARFVGSTHTINENPTRNRCSIEFTCSAMVLDLQRWNITPNKSITYSPPTGLKYQKDFLRGLFDGDGTICESFSNKNSITATLYAGLTCSYSCRDWFYNICNNELGISLKQHEKENCVCITMNTNKSKIFLTHIYEDSTVGFRLDRKYELFTKIVVNNIRKVR